MKTITQKENDFGHSTRTRILDPDKDVPLLPEEERQFLRDLLAAGLSISLQTNPRHADFVYAGCISEFAIRENRIVDLRIGLPIYSQKFRDWNFPGSIGGLTALESLKLNCFQNNDFPPEMRRLTALKSLEIEEHLLNPDDAPNSGSDDEDYTPMFAAEGKDYPANLAHFPALESLSLWMAGFQSLPTSLIASPCLDSITLAMGDPALFRPIHAMAQLTSLRLYDMPLADLPADFLGNAHMTELFLQNNDITAIPPFIFSQLALERLVIKNPIHHVPEDINRLQSLKVLEISKARLEDFPAAVTELLSLEDLTLANETNDAKESNGINEANGANGTNDAQDPQTHSPSMVLPQEIGNLSHLRRLAIWLRRFDHIPQTITRLRNLEYLLLYNGGLESIPPWIGEMGGLIQLTLDDHEIREICPELDRLQSLYFLTLKGNRLTKIDDAVFRLKHLQILDVSNNQIHEIHDLPPHSVECHNLEELRLTGNPIRQIPDWLKNLPALKKCLLDSK